MELLNALLSIPSLFVNEKNEVQNTPLCSAIEKRDIAIIERIIIDPRCDVELLGYEQKTPLFMAVELDDLEIVDLLLNKGKALPNSPNNDGKTPLFMAVENGNAEIVQKLLEAGAKPNLWPYQGKYVIDIATDENIKQMLGKYS